MSSDRPPRRTPRWLILLRVAFLALIAYLVLFGFQTAKLYTDWLWFGELGQAGVFRTTIAARFTLFFGVGLLFFLAVYLNVWIAHRLGDKDAARPRIFEDEREQIIENLRRALRAGAFAISVILAFLVGGNAATHWPEYLLFTRAGEFGSKDPVFGADIGFFVFRLPFLNYLQSLALFALAASAIGAALVHLSERAVEITQGGIGRVEPHVQKHLLVLAGLIALVASWGALLGRYDLVYSQNGAFYGAGYTDLHARLPAITGQGLLMALVGLLCFLNLRVGRPFRLPVAGLALWAVWSLLGAGLYPGFVQKFTVIPNQFGKESPFIARDIEFTRRAFGLDKVKEERVDSAPVLTRDEIAENRATLDNVRLWDWPQLGQVFTVKEALRRYYRFNLPANASFTTGDYNIDVDRYRLGDEYRQVMVAPRELDTNELPEEARTWQNLHLQYTHGYGAVMSPVNAVDSDGLPEYFLNQIPVRSTRPELSIEQPRIYFGELTNDYVFVNSKQNEFDYPSLEKNSNEEIRYAGRAGTPLGGFFKRMMWSARLGDANMLLSGDLNPQSRILFRRNIRERVQTLAPFLNWDNDPYVVISGGRMVWILDGYTVTNRFPYSKPVEVGGPGSVGQAFNYIRNSVKATVDAYDGTVNFYLWDTNDPIVKTWERVFPGLFQPMDRMPEELRSHARYPEDLFRVQRQMFATYHITDPRVYYGKEDKWTVPAEPNPDTDGLGRFANQRMMPYYVVMKLPKEADEEFLLMTPFTPLDKPNLSAWMCARCDPKDYGRLIVYRFPKGSNINGPSIIMSQIKAQEEISQKQTLLGSVGSRLIYGNLLIIPVAKSLLYVVPIYVQADATAKDVVPQINQVIVATGDRIVMRPNLDAALEALGASRAARDGRPSARPPTAAAPDLPVSAATGTTADLLNRARAALQRAQDQQQANSKALGELERALQELAKRVWESGR